MAFQFTLEEIERSNQGPYIFSLLFFHKRSMLIKTERLYMTSYYKMCF